MDDHMGVVWTVASTATGAILVLGSIMWADRKIRGAWYCFAAGFFPLVVANLIWAPMADNSFWRIGISGAIGAITGAICLIGATEILHGSARAQSEPGGTSTVAPNQASPSSPVIISGSDNVVSVGQIGGITAKTVTINPPMHPELRILDRTEINNHDGTRTTVVQTEIASPITPSLLHLEIQADGLQEVQIQPPAKNGVSSITIRNVSRIGNLFSADIPEPRGKYIIVVRTAGSSDIKLDASF